LGEHTREVLAQHGFSDAEIDAMLAKGVALAK
jgi:crotonobetainyl-CoA:carnitine CoA-transferase CaiB-like acyl-CoA transferase